MGDSKASGAPRWVGTVAYLVNQYPKVSHSFIRREILALEAGGMEVLRFAMRGWNAVIVDPDDERERGRTRYLLSGGLVPLVGQALVAALRSPHRFAQALALAWRMGRRADRGAAYHFVYLLEACRLNSWLRKTRATHLHAHFGTNGAEVAMLARVLGGLPYSFTVHGPEEFDKPEFLGLAEKAARAKFVVAISSYGRSQLYRWVGAGMWPKIEVVPCGLDDAFHSGAAPAPATAPRLVSIGRLCEQKGQLLLLEAAQTLMSEGADFELVLAGDGEMREAVDAAILRLGLGRHVRVTGWISSAQVREELIAARALVMASFAEGLPVVIMEAMALARPVVTTGIAGIPELVQDGVTGWLVTAGDVAALAAAMQECLRAAPATLAAMGARGRERVIERHDIDAAAARLAELFGAAEAAGG